MKVSNFETILNDFRKRGLLLKTERQVLDSKVRISYAFKDIESHNEFVETIDATETVSDSCLEQSGYKFKRSYLLV